ncbi:MAG: biotin carboxylase, partial [Coriobacteriaceae bacterium]
HEELLVLIEKLADIHAGLFNYERTLTQEDLVRFMQVEYGRVGADTHLTPREVIRDFVEMLDILSQNPSLTIDNLLSSDQLNAPVQSAVEEREASANRSKGVTVPATQTRRDDDFTEFSI